MRLILFVPFLLIAAASCGQRNALVYRAKDKEVMADTVLRASLTKQLQAIYEDDQKYRQQVEGISIRYGMASKEMNDLARKMDEMDSVNLVKVESVLDQYGWLGQRTIGEDGNAALYLVVQHADRQTREKYLPLIRDAVRHQRALPSDLARMEDRILLGQDKKQRYGTQLGFDRKTGKYFLFPLEDPDHVEQRRAKMGLNSLSAYLGQFGIVKIPLPD
ncbi:DUF6624 domain-containing protein [Pedobacter cryoconitis]|uniref:Lipoprotein n=1 Tax=Pedobacter cryoconitis TaxID=188932 RepID=A0A7X0J773_9SPHI|nr:DUF6624 domain-containing protein [Pedobacter cryoconitis]MBB6501909.1 hypothetical protein [Pedobacter cryoconitis]